MVRRLNRRRLVSRNGLDTVFADNLAGRRAVDMVSRSS